MNDNTAPQIDDTADQVTDAPKSKKARHLKPVDSTSQDATPETQPDTPAASTKSLADMLAERQALDAEINSMRTEARATAIAQIKALMADNLLTLSDLGSGAKRGPKAGGSLKGSTVAAKYKDPETGATWTGRGMTPKWLKAAEAAGKTRADFTV